MSENEEGDPYLQYQQMLSYATVGNPLSTLMSSGVRLEPNNQREPQSQSIPYHQQPHSEPPQSPKRIPIEIKPQPPPVDSTLKRVPHNYLSPQHLSRTQQTRADIRLKILTENTRLKSSIETLKKDIHSHRSNQLKIAEIIKESKQKISNYKAMVKEKSKRISEMTEKNIQLREEKDDLKDKIQWQEKMIKDLRRQLREKEEQQNKDEVLQARLNHLQSVLRNYESQIMRHQENKSVSMSRSRQDPDHGSYEMPDKRSQHWGTMNQLQLKDIEGMRQKESQRQEEYEKIKENNMLLEERIRQLEMQVKNGRTELKDKEKQWQEQKDEYLEKIATLEKEVEIKLKKSVHMDSKIQLQEEENSVLEKEVSKLHQELERGKQSEKMVQERYQETIQELTKVIESKKELIMDLTSKMQDKDRQSRKEIVDFQMVLAQTEEKYSSHIAQLQQHIQSLTQRCSQQQQIAQDNRIKLQLQRSLRQQQEERQKQAYRFLKQKADIQNQLEDYHQEVQRLREENHILTDRLLRISEANNRYEEERGQYEAEMEKYARQIDELKEMLTKLNKDYKNGTRREQVPVQKVIAEQEEESYGSLASDQHIHQQQPPQQRPLNNDQELSQTNSLVVTNTHKVVSAHLQQQSQLSEPREESLYQDNNNIDYLQKQIEKIKEQKEKMEQAYKAKIQKLEQEFQLEKIQMKFAYEQQLEDNQIGQRVQQLSRSMKRISRNLEEKQEMLIKKDEQIKDLKQRLAQIHVRHQDQVKKLNYLIQNQRQELKSKNQAIIMHQITFQKQKQQNMQLSSRYSKLEEDQRSSQREKLTLLSSKADLQGQIQELKYEHEKEVSSKSLRFSRQIEQLKSKLQIEIEERCNEENKMYFSQQMSQKEKEIQITSKQKIQIMEHRLENLKNQASKLAEQNNQLTQEKKALERQLELIRSQNDLLKSQSETVKAELQTSRSKTNLIQNQYDQLKKLIQAAQERIECSQRLIRQQKQEIDKKNIQKQGMSNTSQLNKQELAQVKALNAQLEGEKGMLIEEKREMKLMIERDAEQITSLKKENGKLQQQKRVLQSQHTKLAQQKTYLQSQMSQMLQQKQSKLELQQSNLYSMKMSLELSQTSYLQQVRNIRQSLTREKQSQIVSKIEQISSLKTIIDELKSQMLDFQVKQKQTVEVYEAKLRQSLKEKEELLIQYGQSNAKIELLQESIMHMNETVKLKNEELESRHQSLVEIQCALKHKNSQKEGYSAKIQQLQLALKDQTKEMTLLRQSYEKQKRQLEDDLQIARKLAHQTQDEWQLKANKLSKELSQCKLLLQQAQKQSSYRLQQSNKSISDVKTQLKLANELLRQKQEELSQIKQSNKGLKQQLEKLKIGANRFQEEKETIKRQKQENDKRVQMMQSQLDVLQRQMSRVKGLNDSMSEQKMFAESQISNLKSKLKQVELNTIHLQSEKRKSQTSLATIQQQLESYRKTLQSQSHKLAQSHSTLQQQKIERTKSQYKLQLLEQTIAQLQLQLKQFQLQKQRQLQTLSNSSQKQIDHLQQDKEQLNHMLTSIQKEHVTKFEKEREEQRVYYMEMERKYNKEVNELYDQIGKVNGQKEKIQGEKKKVQGEMEQIKKKMEEMNIEMEQMRERKDKDQEWLKEYENERHQLTEKIAQLTAQSSEVSEVVQSLRNDLMAKNDQLYQYKQQLQYISSRMNNEPSSNQIPISIDIDRQALQDMIQKLQAVNRQIIAKNDILQAQINQKTKIQLHLTQQLQQLRSKRRKMSGDSWAGRNKMHEEGESLQKEVEYYKMQIESAQAYIEQLEAQLRQNKKESDNKQSGHSLEELDLKAKIAVYEGEIGDLRAKVQYQQAYINHLQADNIKASIMSKHSLKSRMKPSNSIEPNQQQYSLRSHSSRVNDLSNVDKSDSRQIIDKIAMINRFIQNYKKQNITLQQQQLFRHSLNNPYLDQLLNTIFFQLQRQSNTLKEKQHQIAELQMENQQYREELGYTKNTVDKLSKKIELYDSVEKKYQETKKMLEDSLVGKLKQEQLIAENRRYIEELERKYGSSKSLGRSEVFGGSMKGEKDLAVLKEANEEEESESMVQVQSGMASSDWHYLRPPLRTSLSQRIPMTRVVSIDGQISLSSRSHFSLQFLNKLLDQIDSIQTQVAYIQLDLQQKGDLLGQLLKGAGESKQQKVMSELQELEGKMGENQLEMKMFMERNQAQIVGILREVVKVRQAEEGKGFDREKVRQCLDILERELRASKVQDNNQQQMQPQLRQPQYQQGRMSLQQIRQQPPHQQQGSSMRCSAAQLTSSYLKQHNQLKTQHSQLKQQLKQLQIQLDRMKEQVNEKEVTIQKMSRMGQIVGKEIGNVLDEILEGFQENQYLLTQLNAVKTYLNFVFDQKNGINSMRQRSPTPQRFHQSSKMLLISSNPKTQNSLPQKQNHFQSLLALTTAQFLQFGQQITNDHIKALQKKMEEMMQYRYEDCLQFLNSEEELIIDILRKSQEECQEEQIMEKLAQRFSREQITNIIHNSYNRVQARNILKRVLVQQPQPQFSFISNDQDFSPDPQKLQQIRQRIYPHPTPLSLSLHNKLLSILAAPTRQLFYDLIQEFYKQIKAYQDRIFQENQERESLSQRSAERIKGVLEDRVKRIDFGEMEGFKGLEMKEHKNRTNSCRLPQTTVNIDYTYDSKA